MLPKAQTPGDLGVSANTPPALPEGAVWPPCGGDGSATPCTPRLVLSPLTSLSSMPANPAGIKPAQNGPLPPLPPSPQLSPSPPPLQESPAGKT